MNKNYLPAIASIFILALVASSVLPVYAATVLLRAQAVPTLNVVTIAEDDEIRNTGIILLGETTPVFNPSGPFGTWPLRFGVFPIIQGMVTYPKFLAQYKMLVSYNGVPVTPSTVSCQVIEKDKVDPVKDKQGPWENLMTVVSDRSSLFACKPRWGKPGVGVLDLYYTGPTTIQYAADYIVYVSVSLAIGRNTIFGGEIQDVCVLAYPSVVTLLAQEFTGTNGFYAAYPLTKPDGTVHWIYVDPLGIQTSCDDLVLLQRAAAGLEIGADYTGG